MFYRSFFTILFKIVKIKEYILYDKIVNTLKQFKNY